MINCVFLTGTQGLIFVVDCADRDRLDEARQELHRIINDREMKDAIILIFANKQDMSEGNFRVLLPKENLLNGNLVTPFSDETARDSGETRAFQDTRTELVHSAIVRHLGRRFVRRLTMVNTKL